MEKCWSYTWDGRQLIDITADGGLPRFTFAYNSDGIRTQKGVAQSWDEWIYHDYTLDGTTILKETIYNEAYGMVSNSRDIYYYYDESGTPIGLNWNGEDYYYYKNIFGDVLGIMDSAGSMVVRYTYDAWGNPISTTGAMASTLGRDNPFRYRGYYYDVETGLYYLNARYYNPEWGRFISIDPVFDASSAVGCNMYVYCGSDPVNRVDPAGESWWDVLGAIVTAVAIVAVTVVAAAAVIAAAPAVAGAVNAAAMIYGASAATASSLATAATVGCVAVATGVAATGINRAVESATGINCGEILLGEETYRFVEDTINFAATMIMTVPQTTPYPSTGRSKPNSLNEQIAMKLTTANPDKGIVISSSNGMKDPRMPRWLGWQKYSMFFSGAEIEIHYVGNRFIPIYFDFKFKE